MNNILAEKLGSDQLELLEFTVGSGNYGINIAKVNEIMTNEPITPVPNSPEEIEGIFIPRDKLITVIDLHKVLGAKMPDTGKSIFVVCSFNDVSVAFHVTAVKGFNRILWDNISEPPVVAEGRTGISTGVVKIEDRIVMILDLEKIIADISGIDSIHPQLLDIQEKVMYPDRAIVIADDSPFLNNMLADAVRKTGFGNIRSFRNGADTWDYIKETDEKIGCVISDIEMPKMDGLRLSKLIKENYPDIPVILFSSLVDEVTSQKCVDSGADAQFSKNETADLIASVVRYSNRE